MTSSSPKSVAAGSYALSGNGEIFYTQVGVGIVVALHDSTAAAGGVIHLTHPNEAPQELDRFFREIILLNGVLSKNLRAKIIGGSLLETQATADRKLGLMNLAAAKKFLAEQKIPLIGEDTGGGLTRTLYFYSDSGRARVSVGDSISQSQLLSSKKRVLIVDDSRTIRDLLSRILSSDPALEVIGSAAGALEAEKMIAEHKPDVMTLDIHMPEMNGVEFLEKIWPKCPLPVVMVTSISLEEGDQVLRSLELGAVDYIQKPTFAELTRVGPLICEKVLAAANVRRRGISRAPETKVFLNSDFNRSLVVAIGASTGGVEAIRQFLCRLPSNIPPIVVVQHIPPVFSKAFAARLNEHCPFEVKEATDGEPLSPGKVLIAPGGTQMAVEKVNQSYIVRVSDAPAVNLHKPSVDFMFESIARNACPQTIAILLTGMGADGARGLKRIREAGGFTIAQDEASCVVFGMPREAIRLNAASRICALDEIPETVAEIANKKLKEIA